MKEEDSTEFFIEHFVTVNSKCIKCETLTKLWSMMPKNNRNYWLITEIFVELHDGKDYCHGEIKEVS